MRRQGSIYTDTPKKTTLLPSQQHPLLPPFQSTPKSCCPSPTPTFFSSATPVTELTSSSSYFTPASTTLSSSSRTYASALRSPSRASPSSASTLTNHGRFYAKSIFDFDDTIDNVNDDEDEDVILDPPVPIAKARSNAFRPIITPRPLRLSNSYWTSIQELNGTSTTSHKNVYLDTIASAASAAADIIKKSSIPITFTTSHSVTERTSSGTNTTVSSANNAPPPPSPIHCKKNLVKTEFCKYIINNEVCKFGSFCNFAHSEEELNYKTLFERHDAGLLDKNTLRTRPCFDFVSTGSW